MKFNAIAGINPETHICEVVSVNDDSGWKECQSGNLIAVPTTTEICRNIFGEKIADIYTLRAEARSHE